MSDCVLYGRMAMNSVQRLAQLLQQSQDGPSPALVAYFEVCTLLLCSEKKHRLFPLHFLLYFNGECLVFYINLADSQTFH